MTADVTKHALSQPAGATAVQPPVHYRDTSTRPMHASTESTLAPTSEFARYFLLALPSRYVFRGLLGSSFEKMAPSWIKGPVDKFLNWGAVNRVEKQFNELVQKHPLRLTSATEESVETALKLPENQALKDGLRKLFRPWGDARMDSNALAYAYRKMESNPGATTLFTSTTRNNLRDGVRVNFGKVGYSLALGVGSLALTGTYANMVYKDLKNIFGEAVGYELNKDPHDVTFADLMKSQNAIVKMSISNFWERTASRFLTDLPFFASIKFPHVEIADFMIGVKGLQLFGESWRRKTTMFEDLVALVNSKINPQNGLGQPITSGEIFDLYQHYGFHTKSTKVFNTIIERDGNDSIVWARGQRVFGRIAELMNQTYAYKHPSQLDADGNLLLHADFPLPKFIYLLGHNLIDPSQPEQSLAYIETANSYGMQAVSEVQTMFSHGATIDAVIARFPVTRIKSPKTQEPTTNSITTYTNKGGVSNFDVVPETSVSAEARSLDGKALEVSAGLSTE